MEWARVLPVVKDFVVTLAAVGGFVIALLGLNAWRRKLVGEVRWDLARRLLRGVYAVRDAIHSMRTPFMSSGEMAAAQQHRAGGKLASDEPANLNSTQEEAQRSATVAAYEDRWAAVVKALSELSVAALEAEVLWGREAQKCLEPLRSCARELYGNVAVYLRLQARGDSSNALSKSEQIVFPIPDDQGVDRFAARLRTPMVALQ